MTVFNTLSRSSFGMPRVKMG